MPVRGKLCIDSAEVLIGFRPRGQLSLYWNQDPVFQFDENCRLRRVYFDSCRFKAMQGRLVRLVTSTESSRLTVGPLRLGTVNVPPSDSEAILHRLSFCLQQIDRTLEKFIDAADPSRLMTVGSDPTDFARRVRQWIATLDQPIPMSDEASA